MFVPPKFYMNLIVFIFSLELQWSQEKLETMRITTKFWRDKEYYGIFDIG